MITLYILVFIASYIIGSCVLHLANTYETRPPSDRLQY